MLGGQGSLSYQPALILLTDKAFSRALGILTDYLPFLGFSGDKV
jgi:hypothetical protein